MGKKGKKKAKPQRASAAATPAAPPADEVERLFALACSKHQGGDVQTAAQAYRAVLQRDPKRVEAWRNLGALLRGQAQLAEGRHCTEQALKLQPDDASLWGNYGNVLRDLDQLEASAQAFREGLKRQPNQLGLMHGLAITLARRGQHQQVVELLAPVVDHATPTGGSNALAELLLELGNAHQTLGQQDLALKRWQQGALSAEGDKRLMIGLNTATVLCGQKRYNEASEVCRSLEPLFPDNANLTYAQGVIAKGTRDYGTAIRLFERALELLPVYPICLNTYGLLLREIGRSHQARQCFERALEHDPSFGAAMNNLGSVLKDVARYDEALHWLRQGAAAMADSPAAHSNVLFTLVGYELEPAEARFAEARRFAERFATSPFERCRDRLPDPDPERVLHVGLVSPDFCRHAVSYFVEPLLEHWDRDELHITLYSCGEQHDDYTARLQEKCDQWRDLRGQSDEGCMSQIQRDEIDILIDLAGHTAGNRLSLFAAKPAPIQATYLGYYGTTGLAQVDYWLTDAVLHPEHNDSEDPASEERWRLDRCYVAYRPLPSAPPVAAPPCLRHGWITFGSFNQTRKITQTAAEHWMAVLRAVPGSRLLLKSKNLGEAGEQERIRALFAGLGLQPERLELRGHSPSVEEHLASYGDIDIALDTYPYTGCTTTADALWMGVPVLTVAGNSMVSRQAASVLAGAGRADWICSNGEDLAQKAAALASNPAALAARRTQQRAEISSSQLLDHAGLAQASSAAFRRWWHRWLEQQGWPVNKDHAAWPAQANVSPARSTPLKQALSRKLPLWLGAMPANEQQRLEQSGYTILPAAKLEPWGGLAEHFHAQQHGQRLVVQLRSGDPDGAQRQRWQRVFPQLVWEPVGTGQR